MIQVVLPLGKVTIQQDEISKAGSNRFFVIFGEELPIYILSDISLQDQLKSLTIGIKGSIVTIEDDFNSFIKHTDTIWQVNPVLIHSKVFNPDYLANSTGQQSKIIIEWKYYSKELIVTKPADNANDILPSYQLLETRRLNPDAQNQQQSHKRKAESISYPVYSLMNIRLRNVATRSSRKKRALNNVISSLDIQLSRKFEELFPGEDEVLVESLKYELCEGQSSLQLEPMETMVSFPLKLKVNAGYALNYSLKENIRSVKITITYMINSSFTIYTSWETEVFLRKPTPSRSVVSSNLSTPTFLPPPTTHLPRVLALTQFSFLESSITVRKGVTFKIHLQIENTTPRILNLVVYHRPKTSLAQTIILLTNDLKIPLLQPGETFQCQLELLATATGYHHTVRGIKMVDLDASDVVELGLSLCILVR